MAILALHPPIVVNATITAVSCYAGNDGQLKVEATGGAAPYRYQWIELGAGDREIAGLKAGTYHLTVTDSKGCRRDTLFTITQPSGPLSFQQQLIPVCYGRVDGSIALLAQGGTPPYRYSVDQGRSFQAGAVFKVGVGTYPVLVEDAKGCQVSDRAEIIQRNDQPHPNFLVATSQSALDTLVVKETSVPKPDSVQWTFDPQAIVLDANAWSPRIRFDQPGSYTMTMTGYFAACAYSLTKTLTLAPYDSSVHPPTIAERSLTDLTVTPNPNDGHFTVQVAMSRRQSLSLLIVDVLGKVYYQGQWSKTNGIEQALTLDKAPAGLYVVRAITEDDAREVRLILAN